MLSPFFQHVQPTPGESTEELFERLQAAIDVALTDLAAQADEAIAAAVPIGLAVPWLKAMKEPWSRTPELPDEGTWAKLDGARLHSPESPLDARTLTAPVDESLLYFTQRMVTMKMRVPSATPTTLRTYIMAGGRKEILVAASVTAKTPPSSASGTVVARIYRVGAAGTNEITLSALDMEAITADRVNAFSLKAAAADRTVDGAEVCYATVTSDNADVSEGEDVYITTYWMPADIAPFVVKVKPRGAL